MPRLSPDGKFILYATSPQGIGGSSQRIMRVGSSGESPQFVMEVPRLSNFACPRLPADVCLVAQSSEDGKKVTITSFDPMQGKPREVLTLDIHPGTLYNWMPSPDGSRIAFMEYSPLQGVIRTLSLKGEPEHDITVKGWTGLNSVDWAGDGKSFLVSSQSPTSSTLLRVDMEGRATPLWDQRGAWRTWAIAAPNGRELAIQGMTSSSNVWMIENF
jgi:Tol biopolymer transport system component